MAGRKVKEKYVLICPKCGSLNVKQGEGYVICRHCGRTASSFPEAPLSKVRRRIKAGAKVSPVEEPEKVGFLKKQKDLFNKLLDFIKNPCRFFEKNKDSSSQAIDIAAFIVRLYLIISVIVALSKGELYWMLFEVYAIFFILARIIAMIAVIIGSFVINLLTNLFFKRNNVLAAERVFAYSLIASVVSEIPLIGIVGEFAHVILMTTGISKQYKLPFWKSLIVALILVILLIAILLAVAYLIK